MNEQTVITQRDVLIVEKPVSNVIHVASAGVMAASLLATVIASGTVLGRTTAGDGAVEQISYGATGLSMLQASSASAGRTVLGLGSMAVESASSYAPVGQQFYLGTTQIAINRASAAIALTGITSIDGQAQSVVTNANLTGPVTSVGNATSIANGAITNAMLANGAVANLSGTNTGDQTITLTGGVTGSGTGSFAATVITNANLTGEVTSVGNAATLTNSAVIGKVLTGYTSGAGTVAATDTILQAIQKLNGNNATNANLTGVITSVGNATSIASQTGTGTKFVVDTSPTLVTPNIGAATGTSLTTTGNITASGTTLSALIATGSLTKSNLQLKTTFSGASGASRNWGLFSNYTAYGDLVLRVSNAEFGDPDAAGTTVFGFTGAGVATFTSPLSGAFNGAFNGTLGATTPNTVAATTLTTTSTITATGNITVSGTSSPSLIATGSLTKSNLRLLTTFSGAAGASRNWGIYTNLTAYGDLAVRVSIAEFGDPDAAGTSALYFTGAGAATFSSTVSGAFNGTLGATTPNTVAATTITATTSLGLNAQAFLFPGGPNVLEQRNGVNSQAFRIYGTYTDVSNYERLTIGPSTISVESAGTGAANINLALAAKGSGIITSSYGVSISAGLSVGPSATSPATGILYLSRSASASIALQTSGTTEGLLRVLGTGLIGVVNGSVIATLQMNVTSGLVGIGNTAPAAQLDVNNNISASSWTTNGIGLRLRGNTYTDSSTTNGGGPAATNHIHAIAIPTLAGSNVNVTTTTAATLYIAGAPAAGTNMTITNPYALYVAAGQAGFHDGTATRPGITFVSNNLTGFSLISGEIFVGYGTANLQHRFGNGYYIQPSTGIIGWAAGATANASYDLALTRSAAATLQLGAANAASPVAQTLQAQGSRSGTDSNVGGANLTIQAGNGNGTGTPSSLIFKAPVVVGSGTGAQTQTTALTITGTLANFAVAVRFGTHSALAAETVTGYITITDSGGTTRKLAVVS